MGTLETLDDPGEYGLWILTHVLEHLLDPRLALRRAAETQPEDGALLVEVPLLTEPERLPPGYFTFEHVSYFSAETLELLLASEGYRSLLVRTEDVPGHYPVVRAVARRGASSPPRPDPERSRAVVQACLDRDAAAWRTAEERVRAALAPGTPTWIWGGGVHTSQLLASTDLERYVRIEGLLDSAPAKWGSRLGPYTCREPATVELGRGDAVVISSRASEREIWSALAPERERGVTVVRLYG